MNVFSKVQKTKPNSLKEPFLYQRIQNNIPYADYFYAPAIQTKKTILSSKKKQSPFVSIQVQYVGRNTLDEHMKHHYESNSFSILPHLWDSHIYLANSIRQLVDLNIIHFDILPENIKYSDTYFVPIITDFGHAVLWTEKEQYSLFTNVTATSCLDILCLKTLQEGQENKKIPLEKINQLIETFFQKNTLLQSIRNTYNIDLHVYELKWKKYLQTFTNKKTQTFINELMMHWNTWDINSCHFTFLKIMNDLGWFQSSYKNHSSIAPYVKYLVSQIVCIPEDRDTPIECIHHLEHIIKTLSKPKYISFLQTFTSENKEVL